MNALDMAVEIETKHDPDKESVTDFVLRRFGNQPVSMLSDALDVLIERTRTKDEVTAFFEILCGDKRVSAKATIAEVVKYRRALGYDPALEAIIARRWRCPHCSADATLLAGVLIGPPKSMPVCAACGKEGIAPVVAEASLRKIEGGKNDG